MVTIDDATLTLARDLGAEMTVNAATGDPIREIQRQKVFTALSLLLF